MINNILQGLGNCRTQRFGERSPYYLPPEQGLKFMITIPKGKGPTTRAGFKYDDKGRLLDADGVKSRFTLLSSAGSKTGDAVANEARSEQNRHSNGFPAD